jgi:phospholipid/cholesterol/gamma-HCH transport system permease protein
VSAVTSSPASYALVPEQDGLLRLDLLGDWTLAAGPPASAAVLDEVRAQPAECLRLSGAGVKQWDSALPAFLLQCHEFCRRNGMQFEALDLPDGAGRLLALATEVEGHQRPEVPAGTLLQALDPRAGLRRLTDALQDNLAFIGDVTLAFGRYLLGRANTRREDLLNFIYQAGPSAFGIITLTSFLVGMILAYLGAAQLAQFGAQIYVADLVTVGMLREMGALMVAVVMAGRTGAAYAAQLGTMQTREEIDAIVTLGISPVEFLVLPRMLALVLVMPLLVVYANVIGILGGALVAAGMNVSLIQFLQQMQQVLAFDHLGVGLLKSVFFGLLIALAGCRAGMRCGRSSAAVGQAATAAVVTSIVYLIVADATFNILFQELGI